MAVGREVEEQRGWESSSRVEGERCVSFSTYSASLPLVEKKKLIVVDGRHSHRATSTPASPSFTPPSKTTSPLSSPTPPPPSSVPSSATSPNSASSSAGLKQTTLYSLTW